VLSSNNLTWEKDMGNVNGVSLPPLPATQLLTGAWESVGKRSLLNDLCLLEAHDACSQIPRPDLGIVSTNTTAAWVDSWPVAVRERIPLLNKLAYDFSQTQHLDVWALLTRAGVRSLDIRVTLRVEDGLLWVHHTFLLRPLATVLATLLRFLVSFPKESIVVKIKWTDTQSTEDWTSQVLAAIAAADLAPLVVPRDQRNQTLETLLVANQRLYLFVDRNGGGVLVPTDANNVSGNSLMTGRLDEFTDRYIDTYQASVKKTQLASQLAALTPVIRPASAQQLPPVQPLYTLNWCLTPTAFEVIACGLLRAIQVPSSVQPNLSALNQTLSPVLDAFTAADLARVSSVALDFISCESLAISNSLLMVRVS
jgi:hypothetical protein